MNRNKQENMHQNHIKYSQNYPQSFTGKERDSETGFSYFGARYYDSDLMTGWLSVDPMADKYPGLSPYAYCAWNPVRLVDPDGEEIWIVGDDGSKIQYSQGMSTNGYSGFTKTTITALNKLGKTKIGSSLINNLVSSKHVFNIHKSNESKFKPDGSKARAAYLIQYMTDPDQEMAYNGLLNKGYELEGGAGGDILWNPLGTILPTTGGELINPITDLAHEMFHAEDADNGLLDERTWNDLERSEWQACYNENLLRLEMNQPLRTHHKKIKVVSGSNSFYVWGKPYLLKDGKPIKPWWQK